MVPPIGSLISECFYEGRLVSVPRPLNQPIVLALGASATWLSTTGIQRAVEEKVGNSFVNPGEAQEIRSTLLSLNGVLEKSQSWQRNPEPVTVAILTGYAAQRDHIRRMIEPSLGALTALRVQVSTVDAFQGKEADVDIFSLTRSNEKGVLGFLSSRRRINVALSRGREALLIVGDADFCRKAHGSNNPMRDVLGHMERDPTCLVEYVRK